MVQQWKRVASMVANGQVCDPRKWTDREVRASLIRDLLLERWPRGVDSPKRPDPHGFRLVGATVLGRLDLDGVQTRTPLSIQMSVMNEGVTARWAELEGLDFTGTSLGPLADSFAAAVIDFGGTTFRTDLVLSHAEVRGCSQDAAVILSGTKVS